MSLLGIWTARRRTYNLMLQCKSLPCSGDTLGFVLALSHWSSKLNWYQHGINSGNLGTGILILILDWGQDVPGKTFLTTKKFLTERETFITDTNNTKSGFLLLRNLKLWVFIKHKIQEIWLLPNISLSANSLLKVEHSMTEKPVYLCQRNVTLHTKLPLCFACEGQEKQGNLGGRGTQKQPGA